MNLDSYTDNCNLKPNILSIIREDHPRCYGDLIVGLVRTHHLVMRKGFTKESRLKIE